MADNLNHMKVHIAEKEQEAIEKWGKNLVAVGLADFRSLYGDSGFCPILEG